MLRHSFCHVPGIGPRTERRLWSLGIDTWERAMAGHPELERKRYRQLSRWVRDSMGALDKGNARYFARRLPVNEHWRLFPHFRDRVAYLDIETYAMYADSNAITTIALYDGCDIRWYVQGRNLDAFREDIRHYELIVTFNGKCFDVPFIERAFDIELDTAHIDLRFVMSSLGLAGGLKRCEKHLGIDRGTLDGVDGYYAVLFWHDYINNGNEKALETLLAYNIEDVVNLEHLMVEAFNMKLQQTPFEQAYRCVAPASPANPFQADRATIEKIRAAVRY